MEKILTRLVADRDLEWCEWFSAIKIKKESNESELVKKSHFYESWGPWSWMMRMSQCGHKKRKRNNMSQNWCLFSEYLTVLIRSSNFCKNHCARSYDFKISVRANFHREILGLFTFWSTMVLRCKTQSWLKVSKSRKKKCCRTVISHQMLKIWRAPLTSSKTVNFMSHQSNKNSAQTPGFS